MALLENISKDLISQSNSSWEDIARHIGIDINDIDKIKKRNNDALEFVLTLTNEFWKKIFHFINITPSSNKYVEITNIDKLIEILADKFTNIGNDIELEIDVVKEISNRIPEWKRFARMLGIEESHIIQTEREFPSPSSFMDRTFQIIKKFSHPLQPNTSWKFWRQYLDKFEDGRMVIREIEMTFPPLLSKIEHTGAHIMTTSDFFYAGHPFQYKHWKSFGVNKDSSTIAVRVGSADIPIEDFQDFSQWVETQQQYIDRFNILQKIKVINFANLGEQNDKIINTIKSYISDTADNGFVAKGYHFIDHICLFKPGLFAKSIFDDHYMCFFTNDGVVLYITVSTKSKSHALYQSSRNVQIANLLHKELNSSDILQINAIVHSENETFQFCKTCINDNFYVKREVFLNTESFSSWYQQLLLKIKRPLKTHSVAKKLRDSCQAIKRDMFTYAALENSNLPSFSHCGDEQIIELEKLVYLTPIQFHTLICEKKHIVIRGPYGSGKSLVLHKRLEKVIYSMLTTDISYLICNDQQSEYIYFMKIMQTKYPGKHVIICRSKDLVPFLQVPKLSVILSRIKSIWKRRTVHVFIDEFSGSYIDKNEILKLRQVLDSYKNSHIVVALQSMEEQLSQTIEEVDLGYQFDDLTKETSFSSFTFEHSLRCSYEINEFVKTTADVIQSSYTEVSNLQSYHSGGRFVDKEYGMEKYERDKNAKRKSFYTSYKYYQNEVDGHKVTSGPVSVYFCNKNKTSDSLKDPCAIYITVLSYILIENHENDKLVICTYDKDIYDSVFYFLKNSSCDWTHNIKDFIKNSSPFQILLTDYASVRGYEFPYFIFMGPLGSTFLKYRIIECLTRATTCLHFITDNLGSNRSPFWKRFLCSETSIDLQLVKAWKKLQFCKFHDIKLEKSSALNIIENDSIAFSKDGIIDMECGRCEEFPWEHGVSLQTEDDHDDSVLTVLKNLVWADDVKLCNEFIESNGISFNDYNDSWKADLLGICIKAEAISMIHLFVDIYNFDVNNKTSKGATLLELAVTSGKSEIVTVLKRKHASSNVKNVSGNTPLHYAAFRNDIKIMKILIDKNAEVNDRNNLNETPLHLCALNENCNVNAIIFLLDNNADINAENKDKDTPLHNACTRGNTDVVDLLLSATENDAEKNKDAPTSFQNASNYVRNEIIELFLQKNQKYPLSRKKSIINSQNINKLTPLHLSILNGHFDVCKLLLDRGAGLNIPDKYSDTPLHTAVSRNDIDIVKLLIDKKSNLDARNSLGNTPIHEAANVGAIEIFKSFINAKAKEYKDDSREGKSLKPSNYLNEQSQRKMFFESAVNDGQKLLLLLDMYKCRFL